MLFEGSMTALVTPFKNGKIDEDGFIKLIERQIQAGTPVLVPCGTTGESPTLTHPEHRRAIELAVQTAKGRVKILAGAGSNSTDEAIDLHRYCAEIGATGTLHVTPYYNKPTQEGLFRHFKAIAEGADLPVVLYNVPGRTSVNLLPETVARLAEIRNIVGIKEASGSLTQAMDIRSLVGNDFGLYSGEDALNFALYAHGAHGAISVTANIAPKECVAQYQAIKTGNLNEARQIHEKLLPLHKVLFIETNPVPTKTALALMGLIEDEVRLPLCAVAPTHREKIKAVLKSSGFVF